MSKVKALVSLVLALALIFTLAACGEQPAEGPIRLEVNPEMLDEIVAEGAKSRPREDENFTAMEIDVDTEACTADIKLFGDMELSGTLEGHCIPIEAGRVSGWVCDFSGNLSGGGDSHFVMVDAVLSGHDALVTFSFYRSDGSVMLSWFGILDDDLAAVNNEYVRMMRELRESEGQ